LPVYFLDTYNSLIQYEANLQMLSLYIVNTSFHFIVNFLYELSNRSIGSLEYLGLIV